MKSPEEIDRDSYYATLQRVKALVKADGELYSAKDKEDDYQKRIEYVLNSFHDIRDVPRRISVRDYHEFNKLQDDISIIRPNVKVIEIGCAFGEYLGMVYFGSISNKKNAKLFSEIEEEIKDSKVSVGN